MLLHAGELYASSYMCRDGDTCIALSMPAGVPTGSECAGEDDHDDEGDEHGVGVLSESQISVHIPKCSMFKERRQEKREEKRGRR